MGLLSILLVIIACGMVWCSPRLQRRRLRAARLGYLQPKPHVPEGFQQILVPSSLATGILAMIRGKAAHEYLNDLNGHDAHFLHQAVCAAFDHGIITAAQRKTLLQVNRAANIAKHSSLCKQKKVTLVLDELVKRDNTDNAGGDAIDLVHVHGFCHGAASCGLSLDCAFGGEDSEDESPVVASSAVGGSGGYPSGSADEAKERISGRGSKVSASCGIAIEAEETLHGEVLAFKAEAKQEHDTVISSFLELLSHGAFGDRVFQKVHTEDAIRDSLLSGSVVHEDEFLHDDRRPPFNDDTVENNHDFVHEVEDEKKALAEESAKSVLLAGSDVHEDGVAGNFAGFEALTEDSVQDSLLAGSDLHDGGTLHDDRRHVFTDFTVENNLDFCHEVEDEKTALAEVSDFGLLLAGSDVHADDVASSLAGFGGLPEENLYAGTPKLSQQCMWTDICSSDDGSESAVGVHDYSDFSLHDGDRDSLHVPFDQSVRWHLVGGVWTKAAGQLQQVHQDRWNTYGEVSASCEEELSISPQDVDSGVNVVSSSADHLTLHEHEEFDVSHAKNGATAETQGFVYCMSRDLELVECVSMDTIQVIVRMSLSHLYAKSDWLQAGAFKESAGWVQWRDGFTSFVRNWKLEKEEEVVALKAAAAADKHELVQRLLDISSHFGLHEQHVALQRDVVSSVPSAILVGNVLAELRHLGQDCEHLDLKKQVLELQAKCDVHAKMKIQFVNLQRRNENLQMLNGNLAALVKRLRQPLESQKTDEEGLHEGFDSMHDNSESLHEIFDDHEFHEFLKFQDFSTLQQHMKKYCFKHGSLVGGRTGFVEAHHSVEEGGGSEKWRKKRKNGSCRKGCAEPNLFHSSGHRSVAPRDGFSDFDDAQDA